ncbi:MULTISPECIES: YolD-like family protein [Bacillus cereus group]|uniref:YolD-like family protein n=1 Tax=Bacillus cereus group TaxID=86661 RepID=UPI000BF5604B|nr:MULTISPECIES: YolD-like family protein [Bacillus cereus group]PFO78968.1 3-oxoacyl-ACP synthase [Bacillus cereus]
MNHATMLKERKIDKWQSFAHIPKQFASIREIMKENAKVSRPTVTKDAQEQIENRLLTSLLSEEEILITYYEDGYILTNYMTVIDIDPVKKEIICTDVFHMKKVLIGDDIIHVG